MMETIRWGIIAPGSIARKFAEALALLPDAELAAVASRDAARAKAFAKEFGAARHYDDYAALAADPDVDAVYIASPHTFHREQTLLCLEADKPVLCEKPFTINAAEAREAIDCARDRGVFLMEAMWSRFLPVMGKVREWLAEGAIGDIGLLQADFAFRANFDPKSRLFDPALGGGGLLDVGVYVVSLASMVFGAEPLRVTGFASIGETGVDEQASMLLDHGEGRVASLTCGVRLTTPHAAWIMGTEGMIEIAPPFWHSTRARLIRPGKDDEVADLPYEGNNGFEFEAAEVGRCLREGKTESDTLPLNETLGIMRTLDRLRDLWGVTYPME